MVTPTASLPALPDAMRLLHGILDIENRIVLGLLEVTLARSKSSTASFFRNSIMKRTASRADLVDHFAQRDEIAGALRHLHRLAIAQQLDKLHILTSSFGLACRYRAIAACTRLT
jgi:hypothetical protein